MNAKIKSSLHDEIFLLLPWYVNETIEPGERLQVELHVSECSVCRDEIHFLTQVQHAANTREDVHTIAQNGFASVLQRVEAAESAPPPKSGIFARVRESLQTKLFTGRGWAVAAPAMVMVVAAAMWFANTPTLHQEDAPVVSHTLDDSTLHAPQFDTVDRADEAPLRFRVTVTQGASDAEVRNLFEGTHEQATYTKLDGGRYVLEVPSAAGPAAAMSLLKRLRSNVTVAAVELMVN